ncbi:FecR domain-containing protein [Nodosilinea sp. LEGE 07298]|uniref:FecR family protein n=1 Tax=Nodosilinea sp. LEGE 07298 TaxID=2777970 RepID=UPI0018816CE0|nr:FecR family protein [Nodosilinea sp. LEGE 07298]MBE9109735.1 FecR domain-containing protein [Nodosilinea sp. LEGE 07298]
MHYVSGRLAAAFRDRSLAITLLIVGGVVMAGCRPTPAPPNPPSATSQASESSADGEALPTAIATIQAIVANPVWVTLNLGSPQPAQLNQTMAYGDQIRTEDEALAEVGLVTGAVFRIGGNAALTLQPNQLQLNAGQMITWVEGALAEPVEIVTPAGIAGIRGTTVFVNIADDPSAPVEIFSWEGEVAFQLVEGGEEVVLTSGEQLLVPPGEQNIASLRQQVQPLDRATALERLEESPLINGFNQPLPTRPALEATVDELQ